MHPPNMICFYHSRVFLYGVRLQWESSLDGCRYAIRIIFCFVYLLFRLFHVIYIIIQIEKKRKKYNITSTCILESWAFLTKVCLNKEVYPLGLKSAGNSIAVVFQEGLDSNCNCL